MSDPDGRDPSDEAYVRTEHLLGDDDAARAARRARVLAAVAAQPVAAPTIVRRPWRFTPGWAAAAVVVLSIGVATTLPKPAPPSRPAVVSLIEAPASVSRALPALARPAPALPALVARPTPEAAETAARTSDASARRAAPPPPLLSLPVDKPPAPVAAPPPLALPPVAQPAPQPQPAVENPPLAAPSAAAAASDKALAPSPRAAAAPRGAMAPPGPTASIAARLRAAAAAGRTAEVEALLGEGVPVDAADARGDTALMKSVRAGHAVTAAFLRRRGADSDLTNRAGESAASLAAARRDSPEQSSSGVPR